MKKEIAMFTASVMLMSNMQLSAFAETAAPQTIPFAVPDTYSETVEFLNDHGNIYVQDNYICFCGRFDEFAGIVNGFQSENSTAEFIILSEESYKLENLDDGWYHTVMVFQTKSAGTLDFTWTEDTSAISGNTADVETLYHFTFSVDKSLQITQTDIFSFTPDSIHEAAAFEKENGSVSIQNGYIVYCKECCVDGGYEVFLNTQEPSLTYNVVFEEYISKQYAEPTPPDGGSTFFVQVLKPKGSRGYLKLNWTQRREWETDPIDSIAKVFDVAPTTSDITDITGVTDFCTCVRAVDLYTRKDMPDVTLGVFLLCNNPNDIVPQPILTWNTSDDPQHYIDYVNENIYPEDTYIAIVSMPDDYNIMVDQCVWSLQGQAYLEIPLATDAEIKADGMLGDANGDGLFTVTDIVTLQKWLLSSGTLPKWKAADFNKDDTINVIDLCLMKTALLKKIEENPPIEETSLTEEEILNLTDNQVKTLYEVGTLQDTIYRYPLPENIDLQDTPVKYHYRDKEDGKLYYASAETDEEAQAFAEEFFIPENDSYTFDGCEKIFSNADLWIYRSYYSNEKVTNKPYYLLIYNKNYYDAAEKTIQFAWDEQSLWEFLPLYYSFNGIHCNLNSFYTETEEQITMSIYNIYRKGSADWGINDDIVLQKTSFIIDKATRTFKKSDTILKSIEIPDTAWECFPVK